MWTFRSLKEFDKGEGTVTLVDSAHTLKTKNDIVLVPQPSDDVNDPLNWPTLKKALAFGPIVGFSFMGNWVVAGFGVALLLLIDDFQRDLNATAQGLIGMPVLALGAGNFFWIPLALYIGKRPAFLLAAALFFAAIIWGAKAQSFNSLVGARIVQAFAASASEGLAAAINADLFFLHERGKWMGYYIIGLDLGPVLGSLMSGFIVQNLGWRWHLWVCAIFAGINLIAIFLFLPETQYYRRYDLKNNSVDTKDSNQVTEKEVPTPPDEESTEKEATSPVNGSAAEPENVPNGESSIPKKTYVQELKPWSKINPDASFIHLLLRPWPLIVYPAVFFGFLAFATTLAWIVCYVDTAASVFQAPPYLMSIGISGLYNVPAIIGICIGGFIGGAMTDWIAERMARRNNGVFEPESRLIALVIPFFLEPIGLIMYGVGTQKSDNWSVGFIGYGFLCFGLATIPPICMTYVIDSYYPVAFEALLLVNGLKNCFAFGFSYGVVPWLTRSGYQGAFCEMIAIQCGVMLFAIPLWYYGKKLRHVSAQWKVISW